MFCHGGPPQRLPLRPPFRHRLPFRSVPLPPPTRLAARPISARIARARAPPPARSLLERTRNAGFARHYYTAVIETLGRG